ncbi:hypothetical protein LGM58_38675 [Burkholderia contaminans]|uniref:hypothetical protein n=1 Tax=Burkholderia contaminans TaxID=488447 RepID=UPI001CF35183|nr:hypothetical protein [Burkholderia contaminans]MCA7889110.1 hypothetical protein [Burkholderia contaminans]
MAGIVGVAQARALNDLTQFYINFVGVRTMNIEIFVSVLAALVAYRVIAPVIDALHPLAGTRSAGSLASQEAKGVSGAASSTN